MDLEKDLGGFLKKRRDVDLLTAYLFYVGVRDGVHPVLFAKEKMIYGGFDDVLNKLRAEGRLWRETKIKVQVGVPAVNEKTKKIYICPFTGKVFGDNTHKNPQDAIYEWVSKCPENTERVNGVRVKKFFTTEDPVIISKYIGEPRPPIEKTVFSSVVAGKIFGSKEALIKDFVASQLKNVPMEEVFCQNRYQVDEKFLEHIKGLLGGDNLTIFVDRLREYGELFSEWIRKWTEGE